MARQKSTDRADARRRTRGTPSEAEAAEAEAEAAAEAATASRGGARPSRGGSAPGSDGRIGIVAAFRLAATTADIPADLRAFPSIATGTKAIWLPALLILASGIPLFSTQLRENQLVLFLGSIAVSPQPTMIPAFLAGMLTRRGSWLAGGVAGLLSAVMFNLVYILVPPDRMPEGVDAGFFLSMLFIGPVFGISVGAFAGFYRRFLAFSAPPRAARRSTPKRSSRGRGNLPRTR